MKRRPPLAWLGALLGVWAWLGPLPAHSAEPAASNSSAARAGPLRLLLLDGPLVRGPLGARLRGQLSDLDVSLEVAPSAPDERSLTHLQALAARHAADVIVWLSPAPNAGGARGSVVSIWIAPAERIYSRRIGPTASSRPLGSTSGRGLGTLDPHEPRPGDVEASATLEAAALVVRGAVRSVLLERASIDTDENVSASANGTTGASKPELAPEPAPAESADPPASRSAPSPVEALLAVEPLEQTVEPLEEVEADTPRSLASKQTAAQTRVLSRAGAEWSTAGLSRSGAVSANLALLLQHGHFSAGVAGGWGLPEVVEHEGVALTFSRRTLTAELGAAWPLYEHLALRPTLKAGAAWLSRTSRATQPGRQATPGQLSLSPLVALGLSLDYELTDTLQLGVSSGVSWLSHTSRYVLAGVPGVAASLGEPWHWQPNAGIALGAQF